MTQSLKILILALSMSCGSENSQLKVFNGSPVGEQDSRFRATVAVEHERKFCSATLIGRTTVLTAAHCVIAEEGLLEGAFSIRYGEQMLPVEAIRVHPRFPKTLKGTLLLEKHVPSDLALLSIEPGLVGELADRDIPRPCSRRPTHGLAVDLVGFGNHDRDNTKGFGLKRHGTNTISRVARGLFEFDGRLNQTDQAIIRAGDSGGSVYTQDDEPCLAGVPSAIWDRTSVQVSQAVDLSHPLARDFIYEPQTSLKNSTGARITVQVFTADGQHYADDSVPAWQSRRYPKDSQIKIRYGRTCYQFSPKEERQYQLKLRGWRPKQGCAYGVGCLDVINDDQQAQRHGTGC